MKTDDDMSTGRFARIHRFTLFLIALLAVSVLLPSPAFSREAGEVVRVGWYESPFNSTDEFGRRSGYAYEYQQKISAYTGWTYEYVNGSWPELLQMLIDGRIDLLSDVSFTEERSGNMLFSNLSMGSEEYYIFTSHGNTEISSADYSTFNGKKIGVNKGSFQADCYRAWAGANGVHADLLEMTESVSEALDMLKRGEIDMYITLDSYLDRDTVLPICKIGSSDFYFAVSRFRPELLSELNSAMNRILDEDPNYHLKLVSKYIRTSGVSLFLSAEEKAWLSEHGKIRVGYQDNYLAFCAKDPETGELTGALKEYLRIASDCLENAHIDFEAFAYPTASAALEAIRRGEVDCAFPANLTDYDGEEQGFYITPPIMRTDMSAVIRSSDMNSFFRKDRIRVAVNAGNTNYEKFLLDYFPEWRSVYFKDTPEGLKAIADDKVDCLLISNYRYNNIAKLCQKYKLSTISTGVEMDYCFAVGRNNTKLYSILSKVSCLVPDASINSALTFYFTEDSKIGFSEFVRQNYAVFLTVVIAVAFLLLFLLLRNIMMDKKAKAGQKLIAAVETDPMTGLYNRSFFVEYAGRMSLDHPDRHMDAVSINIEKFHSANIINGKEFGNQVIRTLGDEIRLFLKDNEGIACHSYADRFSIYCTHFDNYQALFDRLQHRLTMMSPGYLIQLRMGVMPWQKNLDFHHQMEQAIMACNLAKGKFGEHLVVFDDDLRAREEFEQRLVADLYRAVERCEFVVYYQPKYDIRSDHPELTGAEALVRWNHPDLGLIPPGKFIPLFERSGQIDVVDRYVWAEAARQVAEWKKKYGITIPVSVNVSRMDLLKPDLSTVLDSLIDENGLSRSDLKLEVTESVCTENSYLAISVIEKLRKRGYEIEMDDFGSGYSSLNMLSSMPVDVLKMDRAFVGDIENSAKDIRLVELVLGLAGNLGIPVVAEGVETEGQLRILKEKGCEFVQGFVFSRPLPASEFEESVISKKIPDTQSET